MRIEIIAVGTELLLGQIANTNAQWISTELAHYGANIYHHTVVGDNLKRVVHSFEEAQKRSDVVIVTGGLGPTEDDLTRDAARIALDDKLVEHEPTTEKISAYFKKNSRIMTENNRKQALVLDRAVVLENDEGMAPGQMVEHQGTSFMFLPGVPSEMKRLMNESVVPYLIEKYKLESKIKSEMLRFIGIGESALEEELKDLISSQTNPTIAPLAGEGDVAIRLTSSGSTPEKDIAGMKSVILERVGDFYFGSDSITIEEAVQDLLVQRSETVGSAESLTGGKFVERIIQLTGASSICPGGLVAYTPSAKQRVIGVQEKTITKYGTVSSQCAEEMAVRAQEMLQVDHAVSFTGVAGPSSSEGHNPGLVYIGLKIKDQHPEVFQYYFDGSRDKIRQRAVNKGFELLFHKLKMKK
ncbi:competence/damage-inducible protein A [Halobacillus sp. A5]|uniref:competence/damage-inducible protein A n=1 Tax=Halobacillus sp. A5 TaxID=2880263 RepID=UPI0020A68D2F|nr:competence/damage-inducible protein A [Halobacillus sp. A5]MCP3026051.1 competence/damage-inducible protein A [Halobacillus sp. A5]